MKTLIYCGLLATGFAMQSCSQDEISLNLNPTTITLSPHAPEVIKSNNAFGVELFAKVSEEAEGNLMLSPLSASAALTMLLNGCEGETYSQLHQTLAYPQGMALTDVNAAYKSLVSQLLKADDKVKLGLANAIFYREGFAVKDPFLSRMHTDFDAQVEALDFAQASALTTINKWASDQTNGRIPKVLDDISNEAVMFLMNALYFKGDWTSKFDKTLTENRPFSLQDGSNISVPTMQGKPKSKQYYADEATVFEVPYGRTNFTMMLVLPSNDVDEYVSQLSSSKWDEITAGLDNQTEWRENEVRFPRFKFSFEQYLNDQLQSMGMIDAFSPAAADLSGIADANIFVSFVKQNTFVEVNEEGTEAAAVTTVGIELTSAPLITIIDKPFVFAIRERTTNTLMFIGKVMNPLEN